MFAKFSVKKPLTIFVSVFMIIILGFVSFSRMTPDLLPGINLPYAMVVTVYPGATPEEIEDQISKPLEQQMASLENIDSVTSQSADSVSSIILAFNDSANMDAVVSEIREKINGVSGSWDEMVGTPYIMKINPDLLPVGVFAADFEGMSNIEVTNFINNEILSKLEGISGVASLDISGNVEQQVSVILSQEKIDAVNKRVETAISNQFSDGQKEIIEQEQEIDDGLKELEDQELTLNSSKAEIEAGQKTLAAETAKAQAELVDKKIEVSNTIATLKAQIATTEQPLAELTKSLEMLNGVMTQYDELAKNKTQLETRKAELEALEEPTALEVAELETINAQLPAIEMGIQTLASSLAESGLTLETLPTKIEELQAQKTEIEQGVQKMNETLTQLDEASKSISAGIEELNKQQLTGSMDLSSALSQIITGQAAIESAKNQLDSAQGQIDTAKEQINDQKEAAIKSATLDITMDMVNQILTAQNFSMPAGYITEDDVQYLIRVGDKVEGVNELSNLVLMDMGLDGLDPIKLSDVADVFLEDNSAETYAKVNDSNAVILSFSKQSSFATKTVSDNIKAEFEELEDKYDGLHFSKLSDQGDYIEIVVGTVLDSLILGAIFAIAILLFFLKDLRPTIIIACSIPISLLFAIVLMYFSGISLNVISLAGLAVGVGMLVDNSVVVIENIYRLRASGVPPLKAAVDGAVQVSGAITASTLTTVCVFLPIVFIEGLTRQLFEDMALTVAYSLLASLLVAITLVPAMASGMLKREKEKKNFIIEKVTSGYKKLATASLKHRWVSITVAIFLLVSSIAISLSRGFIFMPTMSGTQISVTVTAPENATFEEKSLLVDEISKRILAIEEIDTVGSTIANDDGTNVKFLSGGTTGSDITIYAIMKDDSKRKDALVSADIVESCKDLDCDVSAKGAMDMGAMMTAMSGAGVSVSIYGDDLDDLIAEAENLSGVLGEIDGITGVDSSLDDSSPELRIVVDKEKAIEHGLTVAQVFAEVYKNVLTETASSRVEIDGENEDIVIYNGANFDTGIDDIKNMVLKYTKMNGDEAEVELLDIVDIVETTSLNSISRENNKRVLTVSATIDTNQNVTLVTQKVMDALGSYETIDGNEINVGGESEAIMEAITQLAYMLLLAIVIIYFIMVAQFQSFKSPFIVMFTIPLAFTGGFLGLLVTGKEVSVIAMVGFVMLSGIIVNNGIVLIDYINTLRLEGMEKREAIITAGVTRLRPILMTSLTTVLGLIFVAVGTGIGSEMMQPVAIVCIGGLLYATLMTLFVVPVMYDVMSRKKMEKRIVD